MSFNPRQWLIILAAAVIVVAAGIYYTIGRPEQVVIQETARPAPAETPPAPANTGDELMVAGPLGERALGDPKAPNIVIEYASMTCSHCASFANEVFKPFQQKYIDTGKAYFILREFPLDPLATSAIMLARCAPGDRFFPIVDLLFDQQSTWASAADPVTALRDVVKQAGITQDSFNACLTNQTILDGVNWVKDRASKQFGVNSTPTFFVNGQLFRGEQTLEELDKILGG